MAPEAVRSVLERLRDEGHPSWLVGGVVRDLLLGRRRHDPLEFDVATPATPEEVTPLFRRVLPTGIEHGTVTILKGEARIEVTTFRGEGAYVDGRRPSSVTFHTDLEADLGRRDFTMNAIAWDPLVGELRDPFGGLSDLRRGLIRAVGEPGERFAEDGLRPLRAVRFAAQLGFSIEPRTRAAIPPALPVVERVSRERVAEELTRIVTGDHAARGLALLEATGLLEVALPSLGALPRAARRHALAVASERFAARRPAGLAGGEAREPSPEQSRRERLRLLRLAALLHVLSPGAAARAVSGLRLPRRLASEVEGLLSAGPCVREAPGADLPSRPAEVRRFLARVGPERAPRVLELWAAEAHHLGAASGRRRAAVRALGRRVGRELRGRPPLGPADLAIDGRAVMRLLGIAAGREVGEALRHLVDLVLEDPARNEAASLESALRAWWSTHRVDGGREPS